jgi:hypothetical protein
MSRGCRCHNSRRIANSKCLWDVDLKTRCTQLCGWGMAYSSVNVNEKEDDSRVWWVFVLESPEECFRVCSERLHALSTESPVTLILASVACEQYGDSLAKRIEE